MTSQKTIHSQPIIRTTIERDINAYIADGSYYADGTIDGSGGATIPSNITRAVFNSNAAAKAVKE